VLHFAQHLGSTRNEITQARVQAQDTWRAPGAPQVQVVQWRPSGHTLTSSMRTTSLVSADVALLRPDEVS
jgi:hypothetical protein